jgi:hypothetical protein
MNNESRKQVCRPVNHVVDLPNGLELTCKCGTRLRISRGALEKSVKCPKCARRIKTRCPNASEPQSVSNSELAAMMRFAEDSDFQPDPTKRCPSCHRLLSSSVICTDCGIDLRTGKSVPTAADTASGGNSGSPVSRPAEVTWLAILRCPFQPDVVSDAVALSLTTVLWSIALLFLLSFTIFWGGISLPSFAAFFVFQAQPSHSELARNTDAETQTGAAFADATLATASAVTGAVAIVCTLMALAGLIGLLYGTLRMLSYLYGTYFAICRRAAYGAIGLADKDSGGPRDLGYVLALLLIAAGPMVLVSIVASASSDSETSSDSDASWILFGFSALWAGLYFPMGLGVFAMTQSLNPWKVIQWAWRCTPDYIWCCLLSGAFTGIAMLLCATAQSGLVGLWPTGGTIAAWLLGVSLNQYNAVVTCTALGMLLRRHRAALAWSEE